MAKHFGQFGQFFLLLRLGGLGVGVVLAACGVEDRALFGSVGSLGGVAGGGSARPATRTEPALIANEGRGASSAGTALAASPAGSRTESDAGVERGSATPGPRESVRDAAVAGGPGANRDAAPVGEPAACPADPPPPGLDGCPAACTGGCLPGNVCAIDCVGAGACDERQLVCPEQYACQVRCRGNDACDSGLVVCPAGFGCSLSCEGTDACGDLELRCGGGSCSIECVGNGAACSGAEVVCARGACSAVCGGVSQPELSGCQASCGCTGCDED